MTAYVEDGLLDRILKTQEGEELAISNAEALHILDVLSRHVTKDSGEIISSLLKGKPTLLWVEC